MRRYQVLVLAIVLALCAAGCGYGTIRGVVTDDANNPLIGANVFTDPPTHSVLTDENGYVIRGVPVGIYTVKTTKIGYTASRRDVTVERDVIVNGDMQLRRAEQ